MVQARHAVWDNQQVSMRGRSLTLALQSLARELKMSGIGLSNDHVGAEGNQSLASSAHARQAHVPKCHVSKPNDADRHATLCEPDATYEEDLLDAGGISAFSTQLVLLRDMEGDDPTL